MKKDLNNFTAGCEIHVWLRWSVSLSWKLVSAQVVSKYRFGLQVTLKIDVPFALPAQSVGPCHTLPRTDTW